jgi:hypothetical protein
MNDIVPTFERMLCDEGRERCVENAAFTKPRRNIVRKQVVDFMTELCQAGSEPQDKFGSA